MSLPQDDSLLVLHNPRCSKSRAVLTILEESGQAFTERRYLEEPLSLDELQDLQQRLGRPPGEWVRGGEAAFAQAGLSPGSSADELLAAMVEHPVLVERPVLVRGTRAVIGRPPEAVRDLL